jgi:hypothetical protein
VSSFLTATLARDHREFRFAELKAAATILASMPD